MAKTALLEVKDQDSLASLKGFFRALLAEGGMSALLVQKRVPSPMPTLITDPEAIEGADPLAPAFPLNAARVLSRLTRGSTGERIAAILRPCEIRAYIELVKLKQGNPEEVTLIGLDCPGAFSNADFTRFEARGGTTQSFLGGSRDFELSPACKACEHPVAEGADLILGTLGTDGSIYLEARSQKGEDLLDLLHLPPASEEPRGRKAAVSELISKRSAYRDKMFEETSEATRDMERLVGYLSRCVNCYNCRVACPVCYCKECVFLTDVFDHEPARYLRWARKKGLLKLPTDTVFFHLTRLAHMSTACIGCGQCSNACPNDIPVMELFRTIAHFTQKAFQYEAGRSLTDEPPLSSFREKEYSEVTGGKD